MKYFEMKVGDNLGSSHTIFLNLDHIVAMRESKDELEISVSNDCSALSKFSDETSRDFIISKFTLKDFWKRVKEK